jgi:hypothetical protein
MFHARIRWSAVTLAAGAIALATAAGSARAAPPDEPVVVELFERDGCPRCAEARRWLDELAARRPDLRVIIRDVGADPAARDRLRELSTRAGIESPGVPAFHARGQLVVGFSSAAGSPRRLEALFAGSSTDASDAPADTCELDASCADTSDRVTVPLLGALEASRLGLPLFTVVLGLLDGFNPCATWVLLFVLAMLVNVRNRRTVLVVGGVFVVASGVVYLAFMAAWLTVFMVLGISRVVTVILGVVAVAVGVVNVKDFFLPGRGPSLGIPAAAKPGIYARVRRVLAAEQLAPAAGAAAVLAVLVNLVELLCTAGLPAVYTAVLSAHHLPTWQYHAYLLLYVAAYMLDDAILLGIAIVTLRKLKLQQRGGRWLKLLSGSVMLALGIILLARPGWLGW